LIDPAHEAWIGTKNLRARFGRDLDVERLVQVPVQLLVGAEDLTPHFGEAGQDAYNHAGRHRVERLRTLVANYRAHGIRTTHMEVLGVAHAFEPLASVAVPFFRDEIRRVQLDIAVARVGLRS
jgi:hypothetical protein